MRAARSFVVMAIAVCLIGFSAGAASAKRRTTFAVGGGSVTVKLTASAVSKLGMDGVEFFNEVTGQDAALTTPVVSAIVPTDQTGARASKAPLSVRSASVKGILYADNGDYIAFIQPSTLGRLELAFPSIVLGSASRMDSQPVDSLPPCGACERPTGQTEVSFFSLDTSHVRPVVSRNALTLRGISMSLTQAGATLLDELGTQVFQSGESFGKLSIVVKRAV